MTLKKYKEKRSFDKTPEPKGGSGGDKELRFVIQKHDASRLHYDFRLEINGVLKSWAVPKGPSLDPNVKRLAMKVEDHPYDYKDFEGIIPAGNYGAGTVIVWDEGTYESIDGSEKKGYKEMQRSLLKELKGGNLKIKLKGKKLKGEFALVKTNSDRMGENAWLLIKHRDAYASDKDITTREKSVLSGKTIKSMEKHPDEIYGKAGVKKTDKAKSGTLQKTSSSSASKERMLKTGVRASKTVKKAAPKKVAKKKAATKKSTVKKKPESKGLDKPSVEKKVSKKAPAKQARVIKSAKKSGKESEATIDTDWRNAWKSLPVTPMPRKIAPMLATLVDMPFDDPDWEFEIKWDGYRAISYLSKGKEKGAGTETVDVKIMSRNQKSFEETYYPLKEILQQRTENMVIDGEIVVIDPATGISKFNALQNWRSEADGQLMYYIFDVLWYEGKDLTKWPLSRRRLLLENIFGADGKAKQDDNAAQSIVRLGFSIKGDGINFFGSAEKLGLEGMIAKKLDSIYEQGNRTKAWLKVKVQKRQEVVIIGYTRNQGTSKLFSSLLLGVYKGGKLSYAGKVGTGFNDRQQKELMQQFKPFRRKTSPLAKIPDYNKPSRFRPNPPHADAIWLKPVLVGEVSYAERTEDGVFRHPSFKGMRKDKSAKEVVLEVEKDTEQLLDADIGSDKTISRKNSVLPGAKQKDDGSTSAKSEVKNMEKKIKKQVGPGKSNTEKQAVSASGKASKPKARAADKTGLDLRKSVPAPDAKKTLLNPTEKTQVKKIQGHELKFTNLDKRYWPEDKITKRDLINYYFQIAPFILPYLKGRPQSLNRFPNGIHGQNFYQKDVTGKVADWLDTYLYHSEGDRTDKHFLVADSAASLVYMASLGCIEMNPWSSTTKKPDYPTWCIIDLDPDKKAKGQKAFEQVIEAARMTHDVLESLGISGYPKTSGSSGMHIYIPLGAKYTYEQSKEFARVIVTMVQRELNSFTTLERTVTDRKGKMYLDFLQNRPQATIAAPYSVRPKPGATVSMPLDWSEVKTGLKREDYHLRNAIDRVVSVGDLFKPVLGKGIDLKKMLKRMNAAQAEK